ncbi:MAG: MarR family transcriptional regulator [Rhodoglobus sp.]
MARDDVALAAVVEQSAAVLTAAGFPKLPARILMTLLVTEGEGMTAGELGDALNASAAAISGAVRYLQTVGIVRRVAQPGSRRDRYELPDNAWVKTMDAERPIYGVLASFAEAAVVAIDDPTSAGSLRSADMAAFYRFLAERLPQLIEEWNELRKGNPG